MDKIIKGVLSTLFKMTDQEIADVLKKSDGSEGIDEDKVLQTIIDKDKDRIAKIKGEGPKWDDAMKKSTKEVWSKVEKSLKENFEIESDLQGDELVEFVAKTAKEAKPEGGKGKKPEDITEDDIKKHPVYVNAEKAWKKSLADKDTEKASALKEIEDRFAQKENFSKVRDAALSRFKKMDGVILPSDPEKADKMIQRLLIDELNPYEYQMDEKGNILILYKDGDKKGKRVEDDHGHAMGFEDMIEKITKSNFDFKVSKDRGAPGNGGNTPPANGGKEKKYTGKAPASQQEYLGLLIDDGLSSEQKLEIKEQYGSQFSK